MSLDVTERLRIDARIGPGVAQNVHLSLWRRRGRAVGPSIVIGSGPLDDRMNPVPIPEGDI